jgi:CIC family chloride channel protein
VASGFLTAVFRLALEWADRLRDAALIRAHGDGIFGLAAILGIAATATGLAAGMVRKFAPQATGSGIPHVEAQLGGKWSGNPLRIILVKLFGGVLAIGTGLALGREGPSVQMGASLAHLVGKAGRRHEEECEALLAAGAGAGLATAFNAPVAGAVFVLEELVRRFDMRITIATLGASTGAIGAARLLLGQAPDFTVPPLAFPAQGTIPVGIALGAAAGLIGAAYNRAILGALRATERLVPFPVELRAAAIGAAVGLVGWLAPGMVGGGDAITQRVLGGTNTLSFVGLAFLLRFALGAISYAARTPGGLFAPMLVLGSQSGLIFGTLAAGLFPGAHINPTAYAVVGMAALFTAVVRAPVTGIILVIELTGCFTLLLPMLGACFAAMLVPTLLHNPPIYDSLREDHPVEPAPGSRSLRTD